MRFETQILVVLLGHIFPKYSSEEGFVGERISIDVCQILYKMLFSFSFTFLGFIFLVCSSHGCIVFPSPPLLLCE